MYKNNNEGKKIYLNLGKWKSGTNGSCRYSEWSEELNEIMEQIGRPIKEDGCHYWICKIGRNPYLVGFDLKTGELCLKFYSHGSETKTIKYQYLTNCMGEFAEIIYVLTKYGYIELR